MGYDQNNIFAKIIRGEVACDFIYEDENTIAFNDVNPAAPIHILIVPKGEYNSFDSFVKFAQNSEVAAFFQAVRNVAEIVGVDETGYRLISNCGVDANQTVAHFHVHLLGGQNLGGLIASDKLKR